MCLLRDDRFKKRDVLQSCVSDIDFGTQEQPMTDSRSCVTNTDSGTQEKAYDRFSGR